MRRSPRHITATLVVAAAFATSACGAGSPDPGPQPPDPTTATPAARAPDHATAPAHTSTCAASRWAPLVPARAIDRAAARAGVDEAGRRRTTSGGRFATRIDVSVDGFDATADLTGRSGPGGRSEASLRWHGPAALLLDDRQLRIVDDRLEVRTDGADAPWIPLGSASGVALDVGRELLEHPFLLEPVAARRSGRDSVVTLSAPAAALRAYATDERRGPVTELLRGARRLSIDVRLHGDELVADHWVLETVVPRGAPFPAPLAGRAVRVVGSTTYCGSEPSSSRTS